MKITARQLKKIVKEELNQAMQEQWQGPEEDPDTGIRTGSHLAKIMSNTRSAAERLSDMFEGHSDEELSTTYIRELIEHLSVLAKMHEHIQKY